ncbi:hypothetical protein ACTMU2_28340 [Cupriavidus basilensis]
MFEHGLRQACGGLDGGYCFSRSGFAGLGFTRFTTIALAFTLTFTALLVAVATAFLAGFGAFALRALRAFRLAGQCRSRLCITLARLAALALATRLARLALFALFGTFTARTAFAALAFAALAAFTTFAALTPVTTLALAAAFATLAAVTTAFGAARLAGDRLGRFHNHRALLPGGRRTGPSARR